MARVRMSYLYRRGEFYYFRMMIPKHLRERVGMTCINKSLHVTDYRTACKYVNSLCTQIEFLLEDIQTMTTLKTSEISKMVESYFIELFENPNHLDIPRLENVTQDVLQIAQDDLMAIEQLLKRDSFTKHSKEEIARLCQTHHVDVPQAGSAAFMQLLNGIQQAQYQLAEYRLKKLNNPLTPLPSFHRSALSPFGVSPLFFTQQESAMPAKTVSEVKEEWIRTHTTDGGKKQWAPATLVSYQATMSYFTKVVSPQRLITSITREDIKKFVSLMREGKKMPKLGPRTINGHLSTLGSFLTFAEGAGFISSMPCNLNYFRLAVTEETTLKRQAYSQKQLKQMFQHKSYKSLKEGKRPSEWWLPILALFTGARRNELVYLRLEDVHQDDGFYYVNIVSTADRKLKNKNSTRQVPLHPDLIKLGFIDFCHRPRINHKASKNFLFQDLFIKRKTDLVGSAYGKSFHTLLKKVGIKEKGLDFHSFRSTCKTALLNASKDERAVDQIVGHAHGDKTHQSYDKGYSLKTLYDIVCLLDYALELNE